MKITKMFIACCNVLEWERKCHYSIWDDDVMDVSYRLNHNSWVKWRKLWILTASFYTNTEKWWIQISRDRTVDPHKWFILKVQFTVAKCAKGCLNTYKYEQQRNVEKEKVRSFTTLFQTLTYWHDDLIVCLADTFLIMSQSRRAQKHMSTSHLQSLFFLYVMCNICLKILSQPGQ